MKLDSEAPAAALLRRCTPMWPLPDAGAGRGAGSLITRCVLNAKQATMRLKMPPAAAENRRRASVVSPRFPQSWLAKPQQSSFPRARPWISSGSAVAAISVYDDRFAALPTLTHAACWV